MMSDSVELRPKLKQDSVFLQTRDGVFLRGDNASFMLKGKSIYRWISILSPYMTGEHTLDDLCRGLEPPQRDTVTRLVDTLLGRGIIKNHIPEAPDLLPEPVIRQFRSQIEYIDHHTDTPVKRFKDFRESHILIVGSGESFLAVTRTLVSNGVKTLFVASQAGEDANIDELIENARVLSQDGIETTILKLENDPYYSVPDLEQYDMVVFCADDSGIEEVLELQQRCKAAGCTFLPALIIGNYAVLGPLVKPEEGPCWLCGQMRLAANNEKEQSLTIWKALTLRADLDDKRAALSVPLARRIGTGLAFEVFKKLTDLDLVDTNDGLILQDLETLESARVRVIRHPLCPACSHAEPEIAVQHTLEIVTDKRDQESPLREDLFHGGSLALLDKWGGIFHSFTDDKLMQIPLKTARMRIAALNTPLNEQSEATTFHIETMLDARVTAFMEGVKLYATNFWDKRIMLSATYRELAKQEKQGIAGDFLSTWSGVTQFDEQKRSPWMPAYRWDDQQICYVPAAAVYPLSPLNVNGDFRRTMAGIASGTTFKEMWTGGLVSALAYENGISLARGTASFCPLEKGNILDIDKNITFLLKCLEHFDREYRILEVITTSPVHTIMVHTIDAQREQITATGSGLSALEALGQALLEFVGKLQSLQYEGHLPRQGYAVAAEISLFSELTYTDPSSSRFSCPAETIEHLEAYLRENGRHVLFVNTTSADLWETGPFMCGRVLLTGSSASR